jgi:multidrug efflux pump subunit AcrB
MGGPGVAGKSQKHIELGVYLRLILAFLLLAAQFEKWTLPIAVVLTVPVAILGALVLTRAVGLENDVYFRSAW